ncbi:MAG: ATP-binding protein [Pirellula sp.]
MSHECHSIISDVRGQDMAKRALTIAAAGCHNLFAFFVIGVL